MVTYEEFKELFEKIPGEPEFEITFTGTPYEYMIIKYADHVSFQRCGYTNGSGEFDYPDLGTIYRAELVDGVRLDKDWTSIDSIVINQTWNLLIADDIEDLKDRYLR